ncbi:MAG: DUF86 domain-containing protein [Candidatus Aminicenantes bacterium]|nr:DUF86 domain-containing protein [Candidatus Aminicenantes bacterium]
MIKGIDQEVIQKKLQELKRYVKELENLKNIPFDEFSSSLTKQWMFHHGLQLSIQLLLDIGNHILAAIGENQIEEYVDVIDKLGEKGIIPIDFSKRIRGMVGLRNILVHEYADIDLHKVYDIVQNKLQDFYHFAEYIVDYLSEGK